MNIITEINTTSANIFFDGKARHSDKTILSRGIHNLKTFFSSLSILKCIYSSLFFLSRKDCLKLLKHLLHLLKESNSSFAKFCSYHAKTTLLHACCSRTRDSDWAASDLNRCFGLILQDFESHLRRGELSNFFIPSQNLLSGPGKSLCKHLADCVKEQRENGFPIFERDL